MVKKKYQRKRDIYIRFMVNEEERDLIYERMESAGVKSLRAFMLKQALQGRIIRVELDSVHEMVRLLSNATNNINQIARRVNQTGNVYAKDIEEIRGRVNGLWDQANEILLRLSEID